jgi:hypothetical protein
MELNTIDSILDNFLEIAAKDAKSTIEILVGVTQLNFTLLTCESKTDSFYFEFE